MPAYKMLTGMRVRLIARQVADGLKTGKAAANLQNGKGRAGDLHHLAQAKCPPGCVAGDACPCTVRC